MIAGQTERCIYRRGQGGACAIPAVATIEDRPHALTIVPVQDDWRWPGQGRGLRGTGRSAPRPSPLRQVLRGDDDLAVSGGPHVTATSSAAAEGTFRLAVSGPSRGIGDRRRGTQHARKAASGRDVRGHGGVLAALHRVVSLPLEDEEVEQREHAQHRAAHDDPDRPVPHIAHPVLSASALTYLS